MEGAFEDENEQTITINEYLDKVEAEELVIIPFFLSCSIEGFVYFFTKRLFFFPFS